jgi:hypothetical protein
MIGVPDCTPTERYFTIIRKDLQSIPAILKLRILLVKAALLPVRQRDRQGYGTVSTVASQQFSLKKGATISKIFNPKHMERIILL